MNNEFDLDRVAPNHRLKITEFLYIHRTAKDKLRYEVIAPKTATTSQRLVLGDVHVMKLSQAKKIAAKIGEMAMLSLAKIEKINAAIGPKDEAPKKRRRAKKDSYTFALLVEDFLKNVKKSTTKRHLNKLRLHLYEAKNAFGQLPAESIKASDIGTVADRFYRQGLTNKAHLIIQIVGQAYRWGIARDLVTHDPCLSLRNYLQPHKVNHRPALKTPAEVTEFLKRVDERASPTFRIMFLLYAHLFVRPTELREAVWSEFQLDRQLWIIPAARMKMRRDHAVPLSEPVMALLSQLKEIHSLQTPQSPYLFPYSHRSKKPLYDYEVLEALRELGYSKTQMCIHGFRATASTLLHEAGVPTEFIEMQLAHTDKNKIRSAYNHAGYLQQRREMMAYWSQTLLDLREGKTMQPWA